jgi:hypothetical protein
MKFSSHGGLMVIAWQTDDGYCIHSLGQAGLELKQEFLTTLKAKWECTTVKEIVNQYLGIDLGENEDHSVSLFQTDMIKKVQEKCGYLDNHFKNC